MEISKKPINDFVAQAKLRKIAEELVNNPVSAAEKESAEVVEEVKVENICIAAEVSTDPDAEVLKFAESLKGRQRAVAAAKSESLDAAAMRFFTLLYQIDPTWEQRDKACAEEWGLSAGQRMLKYCGIVLDQQLHLNLLHGYEQLDVPLSAPSIAVDPLQGICPSCKQTFVRKIAGQVCCSNECGAKHFPRPEPKKNDYDEAFNRFIESQVNQPVMQPDTVRGVGLPMSGNLR